MLVDNCRVASQIDRFTVVSAICYSHELATYKYNVMHNINRQFNLAKELLCANLEYSQTFFLKCAQGMLKKREWLF